MDEMTLDELVATAYEARQKIKEAKEEYNHYRKMLIDALPPGELIDTDLIDVKIVQTTKVNANAMRAHFPPDKRPELWREVPCQANILREFLEREELELFTEPGSPRLDMHLNEKGRSK